MKIQLDLVKPAYAEALQKIQELERQLAELKNSHQVADNNSSQVEELKQENAKYKSEDIFSLAPQTITSKEKFWYFEHYPSVQWESSNPMYSMATIPELEKPVLHYFYQGVGPDSNYQVTKIRFVKNIFLQRKFEANFIVMANQQHHLEVSPFYERFPVTDYKEAVLNRFSKNYRRVSQNEKIKLIQTLIGFSANHVDAVCSTGPADLRKRDKGYFGAGIYSTLQSKYAVQYCSESKDGEFCVLLCWIAVGNVYPICREQDYQRGGGTSKFWDNDNGIALKPCFDSHCVCVSEKRKMQAADFDPDNKENPFGEDVFDEVVVKESSQVLPYCILYFKK